MEEERQAHRKMSETLQKAAHETLKMTGEAVTVSKSAHMSEMAHMAAFAMDAVQRNTRLWVRLGDFVGGSLQRAQAALRAAETRLSDEDNYVDKQSEEETKRKDAAEATTREKAEEENKWLEKMRGPIQVTYYFACFCPQVLDFRCAEPVETEHGGAEADGDAVGVASCEVESLARGY